MHYKSQYKKNFYKNRYLYIYFIFILIISLLSVLFTYFLVDKFPNVFDENKKLVLLQMQFDYGKLVNNIFYKGSYIQKYNDIDSFLVRLPFLPLVTSYIGKLTLNIYFFLIIKNIIFFSIYYLSVVLFVKSQKTTNDIIYLFILLSIYFYNFYNTSTTFNFFFSDSYISIILPSIFLLLISENKHRYLLIAFLLFCLYLTKSSMFFVCMICPIMFFLIEKEFNFVKRALPIIFVLIAVISWGTFGVLKTGKFPFASTLSSVNQEGLSRILNDDFKNYYPKKSVDLIPFNKIEKTLNNEWEYFYLYKKNNLDFIKNNPKEFIYGIILKTKFILLNFRKDGVFPDRNGAYNNPIMISHILNRILNLAFIIIIISKLLRDFNFKKYDKLDIYSVVLYLPFLFPYLVGWATSKHLVPIFLTINLYIFIKIFNLKFKD